MTEEQLRLMSQKFIQDTSVVSKMIAYKTKIQTSLASVITERRKKVNLRNGVEDPKTVSNVINISISELGKVTKNEENMFIISMAASIVLKELDFNKFKTPSGQLDIYNSLEKI